MKRILMMLAISAGAATVQAQVAVTGEQSADKSQAAAQVTISTTDRTFVPLTVESKKTAVSADTTRTESTTKALLGDGSYFDWRTSQSQTKKLSDSQSETTSETVERDRQGGVRVTRSAVEKTTKDADGTVHDTHSQYRRNSSGGLVLDTENSSVSKPNQDGSVSTIKTESRLDTSGNLQPMQRVQETVVKVSNNENRTERTVQSFDHMNASFADTARETTLERKDGNTTTTETLVQKPNGGAWQNQARIITTETKGADGSTVRETIEQVRPAYAPGDSSARASVALEPKQKTVEREVRQADGTTVIERQVLHRDINGEWKPDTFSTEAAQKGY